MFVQISDTDPRGVLAFDLQDVLKHLEPEAEALEWAILEFEAMGTEEHGRRVYALEFRCRETERGVRVSWSELKALGAMIFQTYNGVFVGSTDIDAALDPKDWRGKHFEIAVEAFDTSYWRVFTRDAAIAGRLTKAYRVTRLVEEPDEDADRLGS
jgi:hypothetical protein